MSQTQTVTSTIERVEVFRNQALVSRRFRVNAAASDGTALRLGGLPVRLRDDSVRVRALAGDARVVDLRVEWDLAVRDRPLRTEAEQEVRKLERQLRTQALAAAQAQQALRQLEGLKPTRVNATDLPEPLAFQAQRPLPAWLSLAEWARREGTTARTELRRLEQESRPLHNALARARDRLAQASEAERAELEQVRKAVRLTLAGCTPGQSVELELSYLVPGASWVPEYELRVLEGKNEAELVLRALVAQRTGEDWSQTAFSFSTADLSRSTELPELDSWRIGRAQPRKTSGWRDLPDTLDELFVAYHAGLGVLPSPERYSVPELPEIPRLELDSGISLGGPTRQSSRPAPRRQPTGGRARHAIPEPELEPEPMEALEPPEAPEAPEAPEELEADDAEIMKCTDEEAPAGAAMQMADMASPFAASAPPPSVSMASAPMRASAKMAPQREKMKKRSRWEEFEANAFGAGSASPLEPAADPELTASETALGFARLRLQGPEASRARGQLKAVTLRDELSEQLAGAEISAEILDGVRAATRQRLEVSWPTHAVPVGQSAGHFATRYPMDGAGSLPADGQLHALTLTRRTGEALRIFRVVPLIDATVYQVALFTNPLQVPLLAGPARVYRGGDFVVTAPLGTTPPQKLLTVNLGVEPGIKVARNTHFEEQSGGLFGGGTQAVHRIEIEVRSKLSFAARVEVFERVPVSRADEIKVEILRCEPDSESYDQKDRGRLIAGGRKFTLELAPGETRTCRLEYRISLPSKRVLVGGNRRD